METDIQQAGLSFFLPVAAAYAAACVVWLTLARAFPRCWPREPEPLTQRRWLDLGLALAAVAGVLLTGQLFWRGWLLPRDAAGSLGQLYWVLNNLIIFAPVFLVLYLRRQPLASAYASSRGPGVKLAVGLAAGLAAVATFRLLRGEGALILADLRGAVMLENLASFPAVFLEGLLLAFLFVRLRWALGRWPALLIPAALFAAGHIPRQLAEGTAALEMLAFFLFTGALTVFILGIVQRSQDIIWLGLAHYLMDIASGAFQS